MTTTAAPRPAPGAGTACDPLLTVEDLRVTFGRGDRTFTAVDGISFDVAPGQTVGLVGESGCGKSVTSLAIMRLLPRRGNTVSGAVRFAGEDLLRLPDARMRDRRGADLSMIFQDPLSSLNPVVALGTQVVEVLERHKGMKGAPARKRAAELLEKVGIPDPTRRLTDYPHQLSGGMRQRALIAMALACEPRLLIADEPTTALDVTIQAQILTLLRELVTESGTALIMITHDLGVVAGLCDQVNVLYAGRIVERAERHPLFGWPRHPYTGGLLASIPRLDDERGRRLDPVPGSVADNIPWTQGCAFAPRCARATDVCRTETPELVPDPEAGAGRLLRCHHPLPQVDESGVTGGAASTVTTAGAASTAPTGTKPAGTAPTGTRPAGTAPAGPVPATPADPEEEAR